MPTIYILLDIPQVQQEFLNSRSSPCTDLHMILHLVKTSHCHGTHLCTHSGTTQAG